MRLSVFLANSDTILFRRTMKELRLNCCPIYAGVHNQHNVTAGYVVSEIVPGGYFATILGRI